MRRKEHTKKQENSKLVPYWKIKVMHTTNIHTHKHIFFLFSVKQIFYFPVSLVSIILYSYNENLLQIMYLNIYVSRFLVNCNIYDGTYYYESIKKNKNMSICQVY